ncbi:MAG: HD domain-containing protein [Syntrophaceae bacterium]|nr:HD domain-containing protein [Syntrophaceae bacterium]
MSRNKKNNKRIKKQFEKASLPLTEDTQEALCSSEEKFALAFKHSPNGICISTVRDGRYVEVNDVYSNFLGYSRQELIGRTSSDINLWVDVAERDALIRQVFQNGSVVGFELRFRDKDSNIHWGYVSAALVTIRGDSYLLSQTQDITEQKKIEKELQRTLRTLKKAINTTVQVLISALESRDPYTAGHQYRVANLACAIAAEIGMPHDKIEGINMAGIIHDIGKLSIPAEILTKPSKLINIEMSMMKEHCKNGYEMLKNVESPWPLAEIVYQHHERINGTGYPRHLKGDEILFEARILSVADVVEAMASHRPYRASLGIEAALDEIEKNRGILYETVVADACLRLFREKNYQLTGVEFKKACVS